jgi:methionyl-tRNA formyltransferase
MEMVRKMDAGGIIDIEKVDILTQDTRNEIREKLSQACVPLIQRNIAKIFERKLNPTSQDEAKVSYARKITKDDGIIDFSLAASQTVNKFRALVGWPGTRFSIGETVLKVGSCKAVDGHCDKSPGIIIDITDEAVLVSTGKGILSIEQLQRPGGKMLPVKEFLLGFPLHIGTQLTGKSAHPIVTSTFIK